MTFVKEGFMEIKKYRNRVLTKFKEKLNKLAGRSDLVEENSLIS